MSGDSQRILIEDSRRESVTPLRCATVPILVDYGIADVDQSPRLRYCCCGKESAAALGGLKGQE